MTKHSRVATNSTFSNPIWSQTLTPSRHAFSMIKFLRSKPFSMLGFTKEATSNRVSLGSRMSYAYSSGL